MMSTFEVMARTLHTGAASGPLRVLDESLSLWGGIDPSTGVITDNRHPQCGMSLAGCVLAMPAARGSSSSSSVLAELVRAGCGPVGVLLGTPDLILVIGALAVAELYDIYVPIVELGADFACLPPSGTASIDAVADWARVEVT